MKKLNISEINTKTFLCRRCGRKLKNPEAQERGMGYICYQKFMEENKRSRLFQLSSLQKESNNL